jgi:hypothetical protein
VFYSPDGDEISIFNDVEPEFFIAQRLAEEPQIREDRATGQRQPLKTVNPRYSPARLVHRKQPAVVNGLRTMREE